MHTQWVKISLALLLTKTASASFSIYANYDHHAIAAALGISSYCLSALNQTVECDQANAARAARGVDNDCNIPTVATMTCSDTLHLDWSKENLTALCTNTCSNSLATWLSTVEARCSRDQVTANGIIFEPKTFPLKYISGHDLACLQDSSETFCILESQKWDGNAKIKWDMEVCYDEDPPEFCDEEMFFDEDQSVAVTDLYHQDQYCSECFLLLWRQRLLSPTLPPGNFTDYLIDQFKVLADTCSTDLPFSTSAPTLILGPATAVPDAGQRIRTKNATTASSAPAAPTEAIYKRSIAPRVPLYTTTAVPPKPTQPGTIAACGAYYEVTEGDTCISICKQFGIDYVDLLSYNTQLDDGCNNLWKNYAICIGPVTTLPSTTLEAPTTSSSSSTVPQTTVFPEPPHKISKDGKCSNLISCVGSGFGDCCSTSGYCGSGPKWCGPGHCVSGLCNNSPGQVTIDGTCGPSFPGNKICLGSGFGNCCSKRGYCGSTKDYCSAENCFSGKCEKNNEDEIDDIDDDLLDDKKQGRKATKNSTDVKQMRKWRRLRLRRRSGM